MIKYLIVLFLVIGFIWLITYVTKLTRKERVSINVKKTTKTTISLEEENMKVKGNGFQCPLCKGEYVFAHFYNAIEKNDAKSEKLLRTYIEFNNLHVDSAELDRAKLKKKW